MRATTLATLGLILGMACATDPARDRSAVINGTVSLSGGVPAANSTVGIACDGAGLDTLVPTDATGGYQIRIEARTEGDRVLCAFGSPSLTQPLVQLDTTVRLFSGGFFPVQTVNLGP